MPRKKKEPEESKIHNYNEKSRENLKQYGGGTKKIKEYEKKFEDFVKKYNICLSLGTLRDLVPYDEIFKGKEQGQFFHALMIHLSDFAGEENLKMQDLIDIISMCQNAVIKYRLLKDSKDGDVRDAYKAIEAIDKTNDKLKQGLGANRIARIDPRDRKDITVVDLINQYDSEKERKRLAKEIEEQLGEEKKVKGIATGIEDMIT